MDENRLKAAASDVLSGREDVVAAYLYGSHAEGTAHTGSDIDIALLFDERPDGIPELEIAGSIQEELGTSREIDVRVLNGADLRFTHQVLKNGRRVYVSDPEAAAEFEEEFYRRYLDMKPLIEEHDRIRMERLKA